MTARKACKEAGKKVALLRRLSGELTALMDELPLPAPEEFEAMRRGEIAWSEEAHIAAVIRNADFYTAEAATVLTDYGGQTSVALDCLWKKNERPGPPLERSLRYLVQERSGVKIRPLHREIYYFDPAARERAVAQAFLEVFTQACAEFLQRLVGVEEAVAAEAAESEK